MRFKKVYVEITNICNLNCSFCPPHIRKNEYMSFDSFKTILKEIKPYTKYIYLHVKGEPLLHPEFDKFVEYAFNEGFEVNITTNGTLLHDHLQSTKYIRQLNISLHATNKEDIIKTAMQIEDCYVNFRVWTFWPAQKDSIKIHEAINNNETIQLLEKAFKEDICKAYIEKIESKNLTLSSSQTNFTLKDNFYVSLQSEFKWPSLDYNTQNNDGYCHATKDHIAILVDGTVVPCCLDNNGDIKLGNVLEESFGKILKSKRLLNMQEGFKNRICVEQLCKNCEYKKRF